MSKHVDVLREIARLDHEMQRLSRDLDLLRRRVQGTTDSARTQAFGALVPSEGPVTEPSMRPKARTSIRPKAPAPSATVPPPTHTRARATPLDELGDTPVTHRTSARREAVVGRYEYVSEGKQRPARRG